MQGNESLRQYLQYHANNHPSATKRAEAQALLNVTGDDGGLNGYFLMGNGTNNNCRRAKVKRLHCFIPQPFSKSMVDEFICQLARQIQQKNRPTA